MKIMNRTIIISVLTACLSSLSLFGQVGVNTATPDPSAALDIHSPNPSDQRGVLLPRMTRSERLAINSPGLPPQALMVFDITDNLFYYFDGSKWNGLVPKQEQSWYPNNPNVKGNIVLDSGSVVATDISVQDANVSGNLSVVGFSTNALVPTGTIIMWSGDASDIPTGWGLCNGHYYGLGGVDYGTSPPVLPVIALVYGPDLRGRFVVGYDDRGTDPGNGYWDSNYNNPHMTGGQKAVTLNSGNLPPHQHTVSNAGTDGGNVSIAAGGDHQHTYPMKDDDNNNDDDSSYPESGNAGGSDQSGATNWAGNHGHNISGTTGDGTSLGLNAAPVNNVPPYYVLVYLIKLP